VITVNVTGRHFEVTAAIREHVEAKLSRLDKHLGRLTKAEMVLDMSNGLARAELTVPAPRGNTLFAKADDKDVLAAIDEVVHRMERQIDRLKDRLRDHRGGRTAPAVPGAPAGPETEPEIEEA
jgi:ribosomal subunit interface protein